MNPILDRLLALVRKRGLTEKQVTIDCKISASSFTDWKKGKASPSVETIRKLSDYFNVSTDYLIKGKEFEGGEDPDDQEQAQESSNRVEFSNPVETELLTKFRRLTPDCRGKVFSYIDGMLAVLPLLDGAVVEEEAVKSAG